MPTGGTYLDVLTSSANINCEDLVVLICCGGNLEDPYAGWSGWVVSKVYGPLGAQSLFFGDFPESLMEYENIPEFSIDRSVSKAEAFRKLKTVVTTWLGVKNPVFIAANADKWIKPILQQAASNDVDPWRYDCLDLRKLYSAVSRLRTLTTENVLQASDCFRSVPDLPQKFGLYAMAGSLGVSANFCGDKATHRAQTTREVASKLLEHKYPGSNSSEDDVVVDD